MNRLFYSALASCLLAGSVAADDKQSFEITVAAGTHDRVNVPVCVPLVVHKDLGDYPIGVLTSKDGKKIYATITAPGLLAATPKGKVDGVPRELHFLLANLKAGESITYQATVGGLPSVFRPFGFQWKEHPGQSEDLVYVNAKDAEHPLPVLRYVCPTFDDSTKEKRTQTYKVFHHLFDLSGKKVTNDGVIGLYPHHRGIFYAFNKITYGKGKKADDWHCTGDAYQSHVKTLAREHGGDFARQRVEIAWHGEKKEVFALEERELTVYHVPGGQLVEFASRLRTTDGPLKLDGDPQHSGFHFRADKEVAEKSKNLTVFVRPDGVGQPGEKGTRNWDPKTKKGPVNMPWNAMSFTLGGKRYTVAYLDKPTNPKEARFSERDYGRIGSYFEYELTQKKPLEVNYRLWLQEGQMTPAEVAEKSTAFVDPVTVTVK